MQGVENAPPVRSNGTKGVWFAVSAQVAANRFTRHISISIDLAHRSALNSTQAEEACAMKNGLYSIHMHMLDGVRGRDSGVLILRDGVLLGGGPHFWSTGSYTVGKGTWKGHLATNQHTGFADQFVR